MGRRYSIRTYVKKENISNCLNWIKDNTWVLDESQLKVKINNEIIKINGEYLKLNYHQNLDKNYIIYDFENLTFTSSLILDIDPNIISTIANWDVNFNIDSLEQFKEDFDDIYLGKGKIRICGFEISLTKLKNETLEIDITALTGDNNDIIEKSLSLKKWIIEFSAKSLSIITYLDLEESRRLVYHNGKEINILLKDSFEKNSLESIKKIMDDYYNLEYNNNYKIKKNTC